MDLLEKLGAYARSGACSMHMPGHKGAGPGTELPWALDITEIGGFDNLHDAHGVLREAMDRAAGLWGSDRAFFLVGGSTCGILAGIAAAVNPGSTVLLPRECHKSVYNALELLDLVPVYLPVPADEAAGAAGSLPPETVAAALADHPEARLVIVTSPTYEGVVSDVAAIVDLAHAAGVPVLVDEAHGAHLGFSPAFPTGAVAAGADVVIQSLHKTLPSLTQTALAHWRRGLVDGEALARYLTVFQTSSPSYLLMGSMDRCVGLLAERGREIFAAYEKNLAVFDRDILPLRKLRVLCHGGDALADHPAFYAFDPGKLVISTRGTSMTGPALMDTLRRDYGIELEMALGGYALAMTSICDTPETLGRLSAALLEIDRGLEAAPWPDSPAACPIPPRRMGPRKARALPGGPAPLGDAVGRVAGEMVWAYPPGVPLLVPGEEVTEALARSLEEMSRRGVALHGERGRPPETVWVLEQ